MQTTSPAPPTSKTRRLWPLALGLLLVAGVGAIAVLRPWAPSVTEVAVEVVAPGPAARVLAVNGRIAALQAVAVRPLVGGTLTVVLVAEGDTVQADDALARIDAATQQALVRQALATLDAALVAEAEAEATFARTQALGTNAARVALDTAERAVMTARQQVAQATAAMQLAQIRLDDFTIRAPLAGTVLDLVAEPGQIAEPAAVLMSIVDLDGLVVETDVDETYATQIRLGQPATLQLVGETEVRPGAVGFVSLRVNEATGGLRVRLTADDRLTAPIGLTVTANITVDERADAITVPRAALLRDASGDGVFLLVDGVAQHRAVSVIEWPAARLIVTDGLAPGDVVVADATGITAGQAISVAP